MFFGPCGKRIFAKGPVGVVLTFPVDQQNGGFVARYRDRPVDLGTLVPRFDAEPSWMHVRNANALIERMASEGRKLFGANSAQSRRWQDGWNDVKQHISRLGQDNVDLATALREFIQEFEHQTDRMDQMMFGLTNSPDTDSDTRMNDTQLCHWVDLIYKATTYAIISSYISDKQETSTLRTTINLTTGEMTQEGTRSEAKVPRKYRHAANGL